MFEQSDILTQYIILHDEYYNFQIIYHFFKTPNLCSDLNDSSGAFKTHKNLDRHWCLLARPSVSLSWHSLDLALLVLLCGSWREAPLWRGGDGTGMCAGEPSNVCVGHVFARQTMLKPRVSCFVISIWGYTPTRYFHCLYPQPWHLVVAPGCESTATDGSL